MQNAAPTDPVRCAIRSALSELVSRGSVSSLSDWCAQADLPESTLRMYLSGRTRSLTVDTCRALADAAGLPMAVLLGEAPFPPPVAPPAADHGAAA